MKKEKEKNMLLKKPERRRCHPCLVVAIGALAIIGAVSVAEKGKEWLSSKMARAKALISKRQMDCTCEDI